MNYWQEALEHALDAAGCLDALTADQIAEVAKSLDTSAEMESESTGRLYIPNPIERELEDAQQALKDEKEKVLCRICNGKGRIIIQGPYHSSDSDCGKCRGEGRHKP